MENWADNITQKIKPKDYNDSLKKAAASISTKKYFSGLNIKSESIPAHNAGKNNNTEVIMNLDDFKKNHPDLYAQVVQEGRDEEFDRVQAHITMGKQCGSLEMAVKNIEEKNAFTQSIAAGYMAEGMKNTSLQARAGDEVETGAIADDDDEADTKQLTSALLKRRGIKNGK